MTRTTFMAASIVLLVSGGYVNAQDNVYYFGWEYLKLDRSESGDNSRDFIFSNNGGNNAQGVAISATDLDFSSQDAHRFTVGAHLSDDGRRIEGRFFWLTDWIGQTAAAGDFSLGTQLRNNDGGGNVAAIGNLRAITAVQARRTSDLSGFESNYYTSAYVAENGRWRVNPMFGIRGFMLDEDLNMNMMSAGGAPVQYTSQAENRLIGLQLGGELGFDIFSALDLALITKGGVAVNSAKTQINVNNASANNPDAPDDSETVLSPFAEIGVRTQLTLGDYVTLTAGYEAVMISNVELGGVPNDLFIFGADPVSPNDTVYYHGFNIGGLITY